MTVSLPPTSACDIVAEVLVNGAPALGCAAGLYLLQPQACGPLMSVIANPAAAQLATLATSAGCEVLIKTGPKHTKLMIKNVKSAAAEGKRSYNALNTPDGVAWLMRYLTSH